LVDYVSQDVGEKQKFVKDEIKMCDEMRNNINKMIRYKVILSVCGQILHGNQQA
jgi:hypothetical protein